MTARMRRLASDYEQIKKDFAGHKNIIVTPDGEYYIVDWAHATQGNASADAARTYLVFCLAGKQDTADKYLDLFCKKADIPKQLVQQFLKNLKRFRDMLSYLRYRKSIL